MARPLESTEQVERLKRVLTLKHGSVGLNGIAIYKAVGGGRGEMLDPSRTYRELTGNGPPLQKIWVEIDEAVLAAEQEAIPEEPVRQEEPVETMQPPVAVPPRAARQPSNTPTHYEAHSYGWITIRRKLGRHPEYYLPIAAPLSGGGTTNSLCGQCVARLAPIEKDILWGPVDEHPAPIRPNTSYNEGICAKVTFVKQSGKWRKAFGASWEDRYFRVGPNGLHYYSTEVITKGASALSRPKNSKLFTSGTTLIPSPSEEEFPILKSAKAEYSYFGLRFAEPEEAILMRVKDEAQKLAWLNFLSSTLKKLVQDEAWAAESNPTKNKDLVSNTLTRIADLKRIAVEVKRQTEEELEEAAVAERVAQAARAEYEHLLRNADRGEGEVAKIMAQIRAMKKMLEAEHAEVVAARDDAVRGLSEAKVGCERSAALLNETEAVAAEKEIEMEIIRNKIQQLREEKEEFVQSRNEVFARWRKMEEHHTTKPKLSNKLLAFSPHDSPCHPLRVASSEYPSHSQMLLLSSQQPPPDLPSP
eukprot:TRINITY_DN23736_c0_g1_i1.p1 TRINITY_DN23736_c0_g1~~TRINITY_DN23736_c0_g1_i1.p1  ORF type:complete len:575 (+),score=159.32 TRINITY_DN23736_c0_g1_i1:137-1726(+)